jgi:phosphatidylinositol alpha-1,6-mannosyltransferase
VSRIHAFKGHDVVLRALADLPEHERAQFIYLVAGTGTGPHLPALKEQARILGIDQQVRWLGFVPEADLPDLYRASDVFVLMTREQQDQRSVEGFGLVFLEAQACGTPAIGSRTGGIPDAIDDGNGGWLIEQDDVRSLSALLRQLINDPESFKTMGDLARQRVEREFTWGHYLQRFKETLSTASIEMGERVG